MSEKLRVDKLILATKSGKKKIEMSVEEAKELYEQLGTLFGETVKYVPGVWHNLPRLSLSEIAGLIRILQVNFIGVAGIQQR